MKSCSIDTPLGIAVIIGDDKGISKITIQENPTETSNDIPECLLDCVTQLKEYFNTKRTTFSLKINPEGTDFQKKVWEELVNVPYGKTTSYLKQAIAFGDEKAIRAIASANGKNPLWIVLPCHRIIGSDGSLTGYAGGLWRKEWLLNHEKGLIQQKLF